MNLLVGDCVDLLPTLQDASFDAVVTDPPYASGGRNQAAARGVEFKSPEDVRCRDEWFAGDCMGTDSYTRWMRVIARECCRLVVPGGHGYVFTDWRQYTNLVTAWESVGWTLRSVIVWDKDRGGAMGSFWRSNHEWACVFTKGKPNPPAHRSCFNTWRGAKTKGGLHPTEKPAELMRYIVSAVPKSTGWILDPFVGTGATALGARAAGFECTGIEINATYAAEARRRMEEPQA